MSKHRKGQQAYRTSARRGHARSKSATGPWQWLITGISIGILGITVIFLFVTGKWPFDTFNTKFSVHPLIRTSNAVLPTSTTQNSARKQKASERRQAKAKALAEKKQSARFEFYHLLPGMEVPLPETATNTTSNATKPTLAKTETKLAAAQYLVQAGSFRELLHAESLKQRLHEQGLSAKIQQIEAEDGIWFRVTLGPFSSETMALTHKSRLAKEKIPGILILQRQ